MTLRLCWLISISRGAASSILGFFQICSGNHGFLSNVEEFSIFIGSLVARSINNDDTLFKNLNKNKYIDVHFLFLCINLIAEKQEF